MNMREQPLKSKGSENNIPPAWVGTTEAMRAPGGRDLADYKEWLGFNEKELEGKRVLDLGSGALEKLSRELKKSGVNAEVISLNPEYGPGEKNKYRRTVNNLPDWERKSVAGAAQSLPFADNSFDVILGLESVTMYEDAFENPSSAEAWAKEIARVLKPGGTARLGEILGFKNERRKEAWQKIIDLLKKLGLEAKIEPFRIRERNSLPRYRIIIKKPELH